MPSTPSVPPLEFWSSSSGHRNPPSFQAPRVYGLPHPGARELEEGYQSERVPDLVGTTTVMHNRELPITDLHWHDPPPVDFLVADIYAQLQSPHLKAKFAHIFPNPAAPKSARPPAVSVSTRASRPASAYFTRESTTDTKHPADRKGGRNTANNVFERLGQIESNVKKIQKKNVRTVREIKGELKLQFRSFEDMESLREEKESARRRQEAREIEEKGSGSPSSISPRSTQSTHGEFFTQIRRRPASSPHSFQPGFQSTLCPPSACFCVV